MPTAGTVGNALGGVPLLAAGFALAWCGIAFSGEPIEPQPLPQDVAARPINEAEAPTSNVLRWKSKPRGEATEYVASEAALQPISQDSSKPLRAGWNITRVDPGVQPAQYTAPADPFNDPFGDRTAASTNRSSSAFHGARNLPTVDDGPTLTLQPTQAEAGIEELPPPRTLSPVRRAVPSDPILTATQPPVGESQLDPADGGMRSSPRFSDMAGERSTAPCDRVYNNRSCCDVETNCRDFRTRLLTDSIRNISLDITAPFHREPERTPEQNEADRIERLQQLGSRTWRNRRGAVVATGKMSNLQNNAVVVVDDSGREVARIHTADLGEDELCYVTAWWQLPDECALGGIRPAQRNWLDSTYVYNASALCHKPLYFEEVQLERYGHTAGPFRQPLLSGAHFIICLAGLPYQMAINPPTECQYPLGYYRPGDCAPWMIQPIPLSLRGAAAEIGVALGMVYLIP